MLQKYCKRGHLLENTRVAIASGKLKGKAYCKPCQQIRESENSDKPNLERIAELSEPHPSYENHLKELEKINRKRLLYPDS